MESAILFAWARTKSLLFTAESFLIPIADFLGTGRRPRLPFENPRLFFAAQKALVQLLKEDAAESKWMLLPRENPLEHLRRIPKIFQAAMGAARRRQKKKTADFRGVAEKRKKKVPAYYQRNFHFQEDGYLSEESAALYDHQVELLFAGAGDAMRRMLIAPLREGLGKKKSRILEIGCGTGSATRYLRQAFPQAQLMGVDLSEPYLELARKQLPSVEFRLAAGEKLPFPDKSFDAVASVFLFHELPLATRKAVLREAQRVLRPGGYFAFVDSLQLGQNPSLDEALLEFPKEFHEPFYTNYLRHPMEELLAEAGFLVTKKRIGFFSQMQLAKKK